MRSRKGEHLATGLWLLGMLLATGVSTASLCYAWRYGKALGGAGSWSYVKPTVLVGQDAFKFVLPSLVIGAFRRRKWFLGIVGSAGFVGLSVLSCWSIFSVEILDQAALAATRTTREERLADLKSDLARTEARLKLLGEMRAVGTVEAEIAAKRHDQRWAASNGCTEVKNSTRAFCATYNRLFGELAGAQEAANLRTRLDDVRNKIASARSAPATADAELQLIATLFGVEAEVPVILRALTLAIVLELAGDFFVTLVWVTGRVPAAAVLARSRGPGVQELRRGGRSATARPRARLTVRPSARSPMSRSSGGPARNRPASMPRAQPLLELPRRQPVHIAKKQAKHARSSPARVAVTWLTMAPLRPPSPNSLTAAPASRDPRRCP